MLLSAILLSGWSWLPAAGGLFLVAVLILIWSYRSTRGPLGLRIGCLALKALGLIALALCLLDPLWSGQRARPGANYFAVVADNSEGLRVRDAGQNQSRGELLRKVLTTDQAPWQGKLEENFQSRRYLFDSRLQFTKDFGDLTFDGRASSMGLALKSLADRYRGQPLAGILLFTDGDATDLPDGAAQLSGLPPIYPVVLGTDDAITDIAVQKVTVTQTSFEDAPVSVQADVSCDGYSNQPIVAQLFEIGSATPPANSGPDASASQNHSEKLVTEQELKTRRDSDTLAFRLQLRPDKSGLHFYRLRVSAKDELEQFAKPSLSKEATLANNSRVLAVDRGRGPYRILYVAGRPNWEFKFLHRALDDDDQVQLSAIIRVAKREPKMDFRGRVGESSNPLFRGFGHQSKEDTEQYDQPVLRSLAPNEDEFARVRDGFPKTAEQLYRYDAIILDDLESGFFTHDQMMLLQKFVSERGGGFLMLGGMESFHEGEFDRTPIGEMMPVYLDRGTESAAPAGYDLELTREGWLQPWARLRDNEAAERKRLEDMPPFLVLNQVREFKPGASAIATVHDASGKSYPALVVQRFGNGRSAALMIGDLWHWGMRNKEHHRDMDKAWRQLARWLVADVPKRIELLGQPKPSDPDQAMLLQVRVRDEKFQPVDNCSVSLTVTPMAGSSDPSALGVATNAVAAARPTQGPLRLTAEPSLSEPGLYEATYIPRQTGGYLAEAVVTNNVGAELGRAQAGWSSDPAADEFRSLKPNRALLEAIARKSGGEVVPINDLEKFVTGLPQRKAPIAESWTIPLWHQPLVFLFALACFVAEWGLRRWKGMA